MAGPWQEWRNKAIVPYGTQAKEAGTCGNRRTYYLDAIERATVAGLKDRLLQSPPISVIILA
jgi:hypothetical protein